MQEYDSISCFSRQSSVEKAQKDSLTPLPMATTKNTSSDRMR